MKALTILALSVMMVVGAPVAAGGRELKCVDSGVGAFNDCAVLDTTQAVDIRHRVR